MNLKGRPSASLEVLAELLNHSGWEVLEQVIAKDEHDTLQRLSSKSCLWDETCHLRGKLAGFQAYNRKTIQSALNDAIGGNRE